MPKKSLVPTWFHTQRHKTRLQGHSIRKNRDLMFIMGLLADTQAYIQEDNRAGVTAVSEAISNAQDAHSGSL